MPIKILHITDFRNLVAIEMESSHGLNILCGDNGSGKTSLLEAIHYLSLGRSFRSATPARLIRQTTEKFSLFSQLLIDSERQLPVGLERDRSGSTRIRIAEKEAESIVELASLLPVRIIHSQSHQLFESGPHFRRKYLDWGLFYHFEAFLPCWRQFERVLKQRNALLRSQRPKRELEGWTNELIKYGTELDHLRRDYIRMLTPYIKECTDALLSMPNFTLHYQPGWNETLDYATVLAHSSAEEFRFGHTLFGPHRADLEVKSSGVAVKHFLSRGQQKLLICAMIIAQGMLLAKLANKRLIYLVDDLPSELDFQSRHKLIALLAKQQTQVFITAVESKTIVDVNDKLDVPMKVFHVEQGRVKS
ncbi:MAG: DNA replication/repair protein RecF [Gammaproteobacteria bacterium]|nr:MAG: DNA replication/repair protein RecF [Gammaproteobacteria bacterium]